MNLAVGEMTGPARPAGVAAAPLSPGLAGPGLAALRLAALRLAALRRMGSR